MSQPLVIAIEAPYVTAKRYAELSGMKEGTIEKKLKKESCQFYQKMACVNLTLLISRF